MTRCRFVSTVNDGRPATKTQRTEEWANVSILLSTLTQKPTNLYSQTAKRVGSKKSRKEKTGRKREVKANEKQTNVENFRLNIHFTSLLTPSPRPNKGRDEQKDQVANQESSSPDLTSCLPLAAIAGELSTEAKKEDD